MKEESKSIEAAEKLKVPDDLMKRMHKANESFHQARRDLEEAMNDSQELHQHRMDHAGDELRSAEKLVEEVNQEVHKALKPPS